MTTNWSGDTVLLDEKGRLFFLSPLIPVRAPLEYMAAVQHDLKMRDADILVVDAGPFHCEIEAKAPLAALLGYPRTLSSLTGGAGRHRMILSHYAPVPPDPGGVAT